MLDVQKFPLKIRSELTVKMAERMFEEKQHASLYQQYRFDPPDELKALILQYLDKKVRLLLVYV